ncbi:MAG TPA: hypothetical protein VHN36_06655, partial [Ilumatobacteraceae bacterium]|nr:hypothetical protein [Ilumatobacteraceae bacterium]
MGRVVVWPGNVTVTVVLVVGLVVGVAVPLTVVEVFGLTVVGVPPTFFGGGVSLPFTLPPASLVNDDGKQSPGCTGACPM